MNRDADIENRLVDAVGEGEGEMKWESSIDTYTLPRVIQMASEKLPYNTGSPVRHSVMIYGGRMGGGRRRYMCVYILYIYIYIYIYIADSHYCTAETNIVKLLYSSFLKMLIWLGWLCKGSSEQ